MKRREFLKRSVGWSLATAGAALMPFEKVQAGKKMPPNIVILFADDLGYGDLGVYGHPTIRTPNLDRMAAEGMKLTQFYSAACVCTPSRSALMTGRLPVRTGLYGDKRRVLFPDSPGGIPESETTLAEFLREAGYATCCVGKWHLGHLPEYLPTRHGFDEYFGIPYSNDMRPSPLLDGETVVEEPAKQSTLTQRYTERALRFIEKNKDKPFFLYFPHTFPHVPLFASEAFLDQSPRGLYGDVVEELDWSVGEILKSLREEGLAENTLVAFTSDNGPWLLKRLNGGSAGLLRGGKGSTWEGGMREPALFWWPGRIPNGTVRTGLSSTLDVLPTCLSAAGLKVPKGLVLDGVNLLPVLEGKNVSPRETFFFYRGSRLMAVRWGPWKAHFVTQDGYGRGPEEHDPPVLFHLERDPSEQFDVAKDNPEVLEKIDQVVQEHRDGLAPAPSILDLPRIKKG